MPRAHPARRCLSGLAASPPTCGRLLDAPEAGRRRLVGREDDGHVGDGRVVVRRLQREVLERRVQLAQLLFGQAAVDEVVGHLAVGRHVHGAAGRAEAARELTSPPTPRMAHSLAAGRVRPGPGHTGFLYWSAELRESKAHCKIGWKRFS